MKLTTSIVLATIVSNAEYASGQRPAAATPGATGRRAHDTRVEASIRENGQKMTALVVDGTTMTTGDANKYHLRGIP